jgi:hypothetical protein
MVRRGRAVTANPNTRALEQIDHAVRTAAELDEVARGLGPRGAVHFVDGVKAAMAKAQELAGDRTVEVAAGDVGGQVLAAGLVDEVAMDVAPGGGVRVRQALLRVGRRTAPAGGS